jgi:hypothetical protein
MQASSEFHQQIALSKSQNDDDRAIIKPAGKAGSFSKSSRVEKPIQLLTEGRHKVIRTDLPQLKKRQCELMASIWKLRPESLFALGTESVAGGFDLAQLGESSFLWPREPSC